MAVGSAQVLAVADHDSGKARPRRDGIAIQAILDAVIKVRAAEESGDAAELVATQGALRGAVRTARYGDTSWEAIAEALGVSRDTAYNQFRRRLDAGSEHGES